MKIYFTIVSISIAILFAISSKVFSQDLTPEQIYEKVNDCVVVILSYDFDGNLSKQGSGVVISDKGWVVTNYHVFAECEKVEIKHNDRTISYSDIIGVDVEKDILILKIDDNIFPTISLANIENLKVGQRVYAIGSPLGMENSLSEGLISGLRNVSKENRSYIQITAGISPGSSGGAVVNSNGELIGISTSSMKGGQNLNFTIPVNDIMEVSLGSFINKKDIEANNYFYKGYNAIENEKYEEAIEYFSKFLIIYPDNEIVYSYRGSAYYFLEKYDKSIVDFNRAIEINPEYVKVYKQRGVVYKELKEFNRAKSDFNKAIQIDPTDNRTYLYRGAMYVESEEYNLAISDFNKAIDLNPQDADAYYYRGFTNVQLKDYNKAITDLNRAIEVDPEYDYAYYYRATAYYNLNDFRNTISDLSSAIKINPKNSDYFCDRGIAYIKLKEYNNAISDCNRALEINPQEARAFYNRGVSYYYLKMISKACEDVKMAYSLGSNEALDFLQHACK